MTIDDLDPEVCRKCQQRARVIDSKKKRGYRWRRHACKTCNRRWSSYQSRLRPVRALKIRLRGRDELRQEMVRAATLSGISSPPEPKVQPVCGTPPVRRLARSAYLGR